MNRAANNYYDSYDTSFDRQSHPSNGTHGMKPVHPGQSHQDLRLNTSYDSHGRPDSSFDSRGPPPSSRHSHYDDRSMPPHPNDQHRGHMGNGAPQSGSPRHQSIPPAHHEHPNYASIPRSPQALQYERVRFFPTFFQHISAF